MNKKFRISFERSYYDGGVNVRGDSAGEPHEDG